VNKKIKPNRYKPESRDNEGYHENSVLSIDLCINCIVTIAFFTVLSLACILAHDFITQSAFFNIKNIEISGAEPDFEKEILELADLNCDKNIFKVNLYHAEQLIVSHPWIESATVKRDMKTLGLIIKIIREKPLAVVKIGNLADILINTRGLPFKEYDPGKDNTLNLPVITGVELKMSAAARMEEKQKKGVHTYSFNSPVFTAVMEFLKTDSPNSIKLIKADHNTGLTVTADDIYNKTPLNSAKTIEIKLGFNNYKAKLNKAMEISEYIDKNFPERTISTMDFFNIDKIFIKTAPGITLQNG